MDGIKETFYDTFQRKINAKINQYIVLFPDGTDDNMLLTLS